jgi:hypothetical protein
MYNFAINKIADPHHAVPSQDRLAQIRRVFTNTQPDIFVMLELHNRSVGVAGTLVNNLTSGGRGAIRLLTEIRQATGNNNWFMVPPIVTGAGGKAEGVGVYYNGNTVRFTGPWQCNGQTTGMAVGAPQQYPAAWANLTLNNNNTLGGQWNYKPLQPAKKKQKKTANNNNSDINFPIKGERAPWLTTFTEVIGGRELEIFGLHAPAPGPNAILGTAAILNVDEFTGAEAANVARALGGDFNVDANSAPKANNPYQQIAAAGYQWVFSTKVPQVPAVFYRTSMRTVGAASLNGIYPDYGYGVNAYDQIFVRGQTVTDPATTQRIINPVAGTSAPPQANDSGYPNTPLRNALIGYGYPAAQPAANGTAAFSTPTEMGQDIPTILAGAGPAAAFKLWANYGKIRSLSDHLAVVIDL